MIAFIKKIFSLKITFMVIAILCLLIAFGSSYSACKVKQGMKIAVGELTKKYDSEKKEFSKTIVQLSKEKEVLVSKNKEKDKEIAKLDNERIELAKDVKDYKIVSINASDSRDVVVKKYNELSINFGKLQLSYKKAEAEIAQLKLSVVGRDATILKSEEACIKVSQRLTDCEFAFNLYKKSYGPSGPTLLTKIAVVATLIAGIVAIVK